MPRLATSVLLVLAVMLVVIGGCSKQEETQKQIVKSLYE